MTPVLLALVIIAIVVGIIIAGQPDEFAVSRQTRISTPPERIFPLVNEVKRWEGWNPWGDVDPNIKMTYDGPPSGVGASYSWSGNGKVGAGRNTVTESKPSELVRFRLEFQKPMKATNAAEFTFRSDGGQTIVTWTMSGKNKGMGKVFGLLINCDKMIHSQFDKGLARMKSLAESAPPKSAVPS